MPQPVIFGDPSSIIVRGILIVLTEKGIPYRLAEESEQPGGDLGEQLPGETVIEHGGFLVRGAESILRYVDEALPGARLQPEAPRQRARMNRALEIFFREAVPVLGGEILRRNLASAIHRRVDIVRFAGERGALGAASSRPPVGGAGWRPLFRRRYVYAR